MKPHVFHPAASDEYSAAATWYAKIDPDLGVRFFEEMERLISDIRRHPDRFRVFDPPARRHFSTVFPFAIIYRELPDRIWIVAVMHTRRQPGYWRKRLE